MASEQTPQAKMVSVGILTKTELEELFDTLPKSVMVLTRHYTAMVYGADGHPVLAAAKLASEHWQVRAVAGLVNKQYTQHLNY